MSRATIAIFTVLFALSATAVTGLLRASAKDNSGQSRSTSEQRTSGNYSISVARLIGTSVENPQGESLGEVHDVLLDSTNSVAYLVVDVGGYLGIGAKRIAIPHGEFELTNDNRIILDAHKEGLEKRAELAYPEGDGFILANLNRHPSSDDTRAEYEQAMEQRISEWSNKMDAYASGAKKQAKQAASAADEKLDRAWSEVKTQWSELKSDSSEAWTDTQKSLDKAWENFNRAWNEATSDQG